MKFFLSAVPFLIVGILSCLSGALLQKHAFARDAENLAFYENTMLSKQGSSQGFGNYNLKSFDGGKQWYAVEYGKDSEVIILGPAEKVFPGLLKHLAAWDAIVGNVMKNGPLDLTDPSDVTLLEAAGFKITAK